MIDWMTTLVPVAYAILTNPSNTDPGEVLQTAVIIGLCILAFSIRLIAKYAFCAHKTNAVKHNLFPFFSDQEVQEATSEFIETKCQNLPPSQEAEPGTGDAFAVRQPLIPFFMDQVFFRKNLDNRFYLVLADSGMGKTTFMINLFMRYVRTRKKNDSHRIILLPLGHPKAWEKLSQIPESEACHSILLLDALDEDALTRKHYRERIAQLVDKIWMFRVVVITCRTQFFPNEMSELSDISIPKPRSGGYYSFRKLYISPFCDADIQTYLRRKFPFYRKKDREAARIIVKKTPDLMVRPMLLNHVEHLMRSKRTFSYRYQIYEELISQWISREADRIQNRKSRDLFLRELNKFTKTMALDMYKHRIKRNGLYISHKEIASISKQFKINLDVISLRSRSLLNRDAEGRYKFAHKSILEYFLALEAFYSRSFSENFDFTGMSSAGHFYRERMFEKTLHAYRLMDAEVKIKNKAKYIQMACLTPEHFDNIHGIRLRSPQEMNIDDFLFLQEMKQFEIDDSLYKTQLVFDALYYLNILNPVTFTLNTYGVGSSKKQRKSRRQEQVLFLEQLSPELQILAEQIMTTWTEENKKKLLHFFKKHRFDNFIKYTPLCTHIPERMRQLSFDQIHEWVRQLNAVQTTSPSEAFIQKLREINQLLTQISQIKRRLPGCTVMVHSIENKCDACMNECD